MLDVCFGESECAMLKYALRKSEDGVTYSFRGLELGKIDNENFAEARKKWIDTFFSCVSRKKRAKILKEELARFDAIIKAAQNGEVLRIWYGSTPCSKSGYYHLIYSLQAIDCPILAVEMPASFSSYRSGDESVDHSWGEVEPYMMEKGVFLQRELGKEERDAISLKWEKLSRENAELRLNVNGELTSVPEDYLDQEIMTYAPDGKFKMVTLVGNMLGHSRHGVSDSFIAGRIEALVDKKELTVVKRAKRVKEYYRGTVLRRTEEIALDELQLDVFVSSDPNLQKPKKAPCAGTLTSP